MIVVVLATAASTIVSRPSSSLAALPNAQTSAHRKQPPKTAAPAAKELPVPFHAGETLKYQVSWSGFTTAAEVEISVPERRALYGWQTWHFRATAHSVNAVRRLFAIDDQFDSYTDTTTLESRQYENYLNELGRTLNQQWRFVHDGEAPRAPGPAVVVLSGTHDPLGVFYTLRAVDWRTTPEVHWPVYDGRNLYDVRAKMEAADDAETVPAAKFTTTRVAIQVFQKETQVSGIDFTAWIADDAWRTPVMMKADLPFGSLQVQLTSASR
jgi:hypothetical protein